LEAVTSPFALFLRFRAYAPFVSFQIFSFGFSEVFTGSRLPSVGSVVFPLTHSRDFSIPPPCRHLRQPAAFLSRQSGFLFSFTVFPDPGHWSVKFCGDFFSLWATTHSPSFAWPFCPEDFSFFFHPPGFWFNDAGFFSPPPIFGSVFFPIFPKRCSAFRTPLTILVTWFFAQETFTRFFYPNLFLSHFVIPLPNYT